LVTEKEKQAMTKRTDDDEYERDRILRDGERLRVDLIAMDAMHRAYGMVTDGVGNLAGHKPGYCYGPDDAAADRRQAARDEWVRRTSEGGSPQRMRRRTSPVRRPLVWAM
jgi:hypothetical protein